MRALCRLGLLATASCYSFAVTRHEVEVGCSHATTRLYVWESDQTMAENRAEHSWPMQLVLVVLSQPFNMGFGLLAGIGAPFDAEYDIRFGPLGFVAGVVVPGLTVMPSLMRGPARTVRLDDDAYARLLDDVDRGDGAAALRGWNALAVARAPDRPRAR